MGYRLVTITSEREDSFLSNEALTQQDQDWWIGINDRDTERTWVWDSGEAVTFENWGSGEPNNYMASSYDCGVIENGDDSFEDREEWADRPCSRNKPYICER